jgi:hypothetical protein
VPTRVNWRLSRSSYFKGLAVAIVEGSYSVASLTRAMLIGSEWRFRFRDPRAVGHGGSGRVCSGVVGRTEPDVGVSMTAISGGVISEIIEERSWLHPM